MTREFKNFFNLNKSLLSKTDQSYSKYFYIREIETDNGSPEIYSLKKHVLHDQRIIKLTNKLCDRSLGTSSLVGSVADYKVYGSFYWILKFFADIGLTKNDLPIDDAVRLIFLYQMPDGQFTIGYRQKKRTTVTAVCMTAHLLYSLGKLGYLYEKAITSGINYLLTTQRHDGGWHCDWKKQQGERDQCAPSCPVAGLNAVLALSLFGDKYSEILSNAIQQIFNIWQNDEPAIISCDLGTTDIIRKLRYPAHYMGLDILNILDTVSNFPEYCYHPAFNGIIRFVLDRWNRNGLLRSEKTIPEWKEFDFGWNKCESGWISALFCRILKRVYGNLLDS